MLTRVLTINGQPVKSYKQSDRDEDTLIAAALRKTSEHNQLIDALKLEVEDEALGVMGLKAIGDSDELYRQHFVNLNGLGIHELCLRNRITASNLLV